MNQVEITLRSAIDAIYAVLPQTDDPRVKNHLANALDSLVSALHGDYEKDED